MSKVELVRVSLQASGRWTWGTEVEMPREAYESLVERMDSGTRKERQRADSEVIGMYFDMRDIDISDSDIELEEFDLIESDPATLAGASR